MPAPIPAPNVAAGMWATGRDAVKLASAALAGLLVTLQAHVFPFTLMTLGPR